MRESKTLLNRFGTTLSQLAVGVAAAAHFSAPASAQIEEVVVYSQKKAVSDSVQDVPSAITVVDEALMQKTFSVDLTDIGRLSPNVQLAPVSTFPNFANFTIRGIGVNNSVRTVDPAVNIYQDGMVYGFQVGTVLDVFDLESVEVLRGPQGILFGRNTTGGAVSLRTARPGDETVIKGRITAGNFNRLDFAGSVEGALSSNVSGKIAVMSRNQDGLFKDNNGGTFVAATLNPSGEQPVNPQSSQAEVDSTIIKPTIVWRINEDVDLTLLASFAKMRGGGSPTNARIPDPSAPPRSVTDWGYTPPSDFYEINHDLPGKNETDAWHAIAELNWRLGSGTLTSITAYRDITFDTDMDIDGTPFTMVHFPDNREKGDQFSQEIRYAATINENLDYVVGAYFFTQEYSVLERRILFGGLSSPEVAQTYRYFQSDFTHEQDSVAAFAAVNWSLTPRLTLNLGGRYTTEDKEIDIQTLAMCTGQSFNQCPTARNNRDGDWSNFSPKVGVTYNFGDDTIAYASATRGYRSGNFNGRAGNLAQVGPVDEESVTAYEVGVKSTFANGRARINAAYFFSDYEDIQRTVLVPVEGNPIQRLSNAADADIQGLEVEAIFLPVDPLRLEASVGWVDAEFNEFVVNPHDPAANAAAAQREFDRVPELTIYAAATYSFTTGLGDWSVRGSYAWQDSQYSDVANTEILAQDSYGLFDASLALQRESYRVALFGRNLSDEEYFDIRSTGLSYPTYGGAPRTYGVEISFEL